VRADPVFGGRRDPRLNYAAVAGARFRSDAALGSLIAGTEMSRMVDTIAGLMLERRVKRSWR
jgi:hypothetical protein